MELEVLTLVLLLDCQGGPHMNSIAGIARLFEIIVHQNKEYRDLQQRIVSNAKVETEPQSGCAQGERERESE